MTAQVVGGGGGQANVSLHTICMPFFDDTHEDARKKNRPTSVKS